MSAERLREAAALMRSRAERVLADDPTAADGWYANLGAVGTAWVNDRTGHVISAHGMPRHAEHIASWHPAVALAVADWLDAAYADWHHSEHSLGDMSVRAMSGAPNLPDAMALAVANAYLGGDQ